MNRVEMTKELLEEVLDVQIEKFQLELDIPGAAKTIRYYTKNAFRPFDYINIFELSYKCKDYALKRGYILDSQSRGYCKGKGICFVYRDDWTSEFPEHCLESFSGDSEIEAIFRATEWVLLNKGNKND